MEAGRQLLVVLGAAVALAAEVAAAQPAVPRPFSPFVEVPRTEAPPPVDAGTRARRAVFTYRMRIDQAEKTIATEERILADARRAVTDPKTPPASSEYNQIVLRLMPGTIEAERRSIEASSAALAATEAAEAARLAQQAGRVTKAEYDRLEARRAELARVASQAAAEANRLHQVQNAEADVSQQKQRVQVDARMSQMRERQKEMARRNPALAPSLERFEKSALDREAQGRALEANRQAMHVYTDARVAAEREAQAYSRVAEAVKAGVRTRADLTRAAEALKTAQVAMYDAREALYATQMNNHRRMMERREAEFADRESQIRAVQGEARLQELRRARASLEKEVVDMRNLQDHRMREADFEGVQDATRRYADAQQRMRTVYGDPPLVWAGVIPPPQRPPPRPATLPVLPERLIASTGFNDFDRPPLD